MKSALNVALLALVGATLATPAQDFCDPILKKKVDSRNPYRYDNRGDRCEGIFVRDVSGGGLLVASLTSTRLDINPSQAKAITLRWNTAKGGARLNVRAYSLRRNIFYRMDTQRPGDTDSWQWPTEILTKYQLWAPDIGVVAWTHRLIAGGPEMVYVPIAVGQKPADSSRKSYHLVIVPSSQLSEVQVSVTHTDATGHPDKVVQNARTLGYGDYPAWVGIPIELPPLPFPGLYRVEVAAAIRGGGDNSVSFWLAGPPD